MPAAPHLLPTIMQLFLNVKTGVVLQYSGMIRKPLRTVGHIASRE